MCSCSTKGQANLVIEAEAEGAAEEEVVAEAEAGERGKCKCMKTWATS